MDIDGSKKKVKSSRIKNKEQEHVFLFGVADSRVGRVQVTTRNITRDSN